MTIKIVQIPIKPYSAGVSKRAKTMPTINVTPWLRKTSAALQPTPETVFFFMDLFDNNIEKQFAAIFNISNLLVVIF